MATHSNLATHPAENWASSRDSLLHAASQAGIDADVMIKIAGVESGFNPNARPVSSKPGANTVTQFDGTKAISSAHGYGQFIDSTWLATVRHHGEKYGIKDAAHISNHDARQLRQNPEFQAAMLAEFTKENIQKGAKLGGPDAATNAYLYHNLGDGNAKKILDNLREHPDRPVREVLSAKVIANNPSLYGNGHMTVKEAYQNIGHKLQEFEPYVKEARQHQPNLAAPAPRQPVHAEVHHASGPHPAAKVTIAEPTSAKAQTPEAHSANPQKAILDYAKTNFKSSTHEYGREDMAGKEVKHGHGNRYDGTRFNQDRDGDGRKGVDCSSLVYYAMKGAGYNVEEKFPTHKNGSFDFNTRSLFEGKHLTPYAEKHFDPVKRSDLQSGDLVMFKFKDGSQHIGIYAGKDSQGHPQFFGSQSSTGPAQTRLDTDYWEKAYVGAIRPKDEFRKPEFREVAHHEPSSPAAKDKTHPDVPAANSLVDNRTMPDSLKGLYDQLSKQAGNYLHGMTDEQKRNVMTCMATQAQDMKANKLDYVHQAKDGQLYHQWDEFKDARVDPQKAKDIPAETQIASQLQTDQVKSQQQSQNQQQSHRVVAV